MINSDIILLRDGGLIFVQDCPFDRAVVRAEFYIETGYLIFVYDDEDSRMIEAEITDKKIIDALGQAPGILLTHAIDGDVQDGFEVPLIAIRP